MTSKKRNGSFNKDLLLIIRFQCFPIHFYCLSSIMHQLRFSPNEIINLLSYAVFGEAVNLTSKTLTG